MESDPLHPPVGPTPADRAPSPGAASGRGGRALPAAGDGTGYAREASTRHRAASGQGLGVPLQARLAAMHASGMSETAIRRALGLSARQAVAAGIVAPPPTIMPPDAPGASSARVGGGAAPCARRAGALAQRAGGPRMAEVVEAVARHAGLAGERLLGPDPDRRCTQLRQLAMLLVRELCPGASLPAIGHFLGRDHTTVLYGCRKAKARLAEDAEVQALYERVRRDLAP